MTMAAFPQLHSKSRGTEDWRTAHVGLWWRRIDLDDESLSDTPHILAAEELERAGRFAFQRDRRRYIAGRTALRLSLAELLGAGPETIRLEYGEHGKPRLAEDAGWHFNLTHSDSIGLIVIGYAGLVGAVGIDVERITEVTDWQMLAAANFSPQECKELAATGAQRRARAFLSCWTRKEACVKALGTGLSLPTSGFTVGLTGNEFAASIAHDDRVFELAGCDLPVGEDCIGAIAWCPVGAQGLSTRWPDSFAGWSPTSGALSVPHTAEAHI